MKLIGITALGEDRDGGEVRRGVVRSRNVDIFTRVTTGTSADVRRAARLFHALSDETRLSVVEMLQDGERCVCELQDELDAAQSRLSFHLKVLKDAGLVIDRKEGRWVHYSLNPHTFAELQETVAGLKPPRRAMPVRRGAAWCD